MAISNDFISNFLWDLLGDSWDFFENRNDINAKWDADMHKIANLYLQGINTDASKGLFTVLVEPKTERHLFLFNDDTAVDPTLFDVELQAESTLGTTTAGDGSFFEDTGLPALFETNDVRPGDVIILSAAIEFPFGSGNFITDLPILEVLSETLVKLDGTAAAGLGPLTYTVSGPARFSFKVDDNITTIPQLEDTFIVEPSIKIFEGTDYQVINGVINFPLIAPPRDQMWAFEFSSNRESIRSNFGEPVNFIRPNDLQYLFGTQGIWYALWNGPAVRRISVGLQILLGLPFAREGTVREIVENVLGDTDVSVQDPALGNAIITRNIDPWLEPVVALNEELIPFSRLSNGIEIFDFVNNPELIDQVVVPTRNRFHTWVVFAKAEVLQNQVVLSGDFFDMAETTGFIEKFKPEYTDYVFAIDLQLQELLLIGVEQLDIDEIVDLTSKTNFNYWNFLQLTEYLAQNAPFTEVSTDPPTSTPYPAEQVYHLDDENIGRLDFLEIFEQTSPATLLRSV